MSSTNTAINLTAIFFCSLFAVLSMLFFIHVSTTDCEFSNTFNRIFSDTNKFNWGGLIVFIFMTIITFISFHEVHYVWKKAENIDERKAITLAIMVGLLLCVCMFSYPLIDNIFGDIPPNSIAKAFIIGSSATIGWFAWYLRKLKTYGELFYVILLTLAGGFAWYSRIKGTDDAQLSALIFLIFSMSSIMFDRINTKNKTLINETNNTPKL